MQSYKHSPVLFVSDEGVAMEFYIRSCQKKSVIKALIEHGGGCIRYMEGKNIVRLVEPGCRVLRVPDGGVTVSVQFILDCVEQNCLLDINNYIVKILSINTSDISDDDETDFVQKTPSSPPYKHEEDLTLLKVILANKDNFQEGISGSSYWVNVSKWKILNRTTDSIRRRAIYLAHLPRNQAVSYGLSTDDQGILRKIGNNSKSKYVSQDDYIVIEYVGKRIDRMTDYNIYKNLKKTKSSLSLSAGTLRARFLNYILPNIDLYDISEKLKEEFKKAKKSSFAASKTNNTELATQSLETFDDLGRPMNEIPLAAERVTFPDIRNGKISEHFSTKHSNVNSVSKLKRGPQASGCLEDFIFNHASHSVGSRSSKTPILSHLRDGKEPLEEMPKTVSISPDDSKIQSSNIPQNEVQNLNFKDTAATDLDMHLSEEFVEDRTNWNSESIPLLPKRSEKRHSTITATAECAQEGHTPNSGDVHQFLKRSFNVGNDSTNNKSDTIEMETCSSSSSEGNLDVFDANILEKCNNIKARRENCQTSEPELENQNAQKHLQPIAASSSVIIDFPYSLQNVGDNVSPASCYSSSSEQESGEDPIQHENTLHLYEATSVMKNVENIITFCPWLEDASLSTLDITNRFSKLKGVLYKSVLATQAENILKKAKLTTKDKTVLAKYLLCERNVKPQDLFRFLSSFVDNKMKKMVN